MTSPVNASNGPSTDAEDRLLNDILCLQCEYDLHGLNLDGNCPECGYAIRNSVRRDLLRFADPNWVELLASGTDLIADGVAGFIICCLVYPLILGLFSGLADYHHLPSNAEQWADKLFGLLFFIPLALVALGFWRFTSPEPGQKMMAIRFDSRRHARQLFPFAVLAGIVWLIIDSHVQPEHSAAFPVVGFAVLILWCGAWFCFCNHSLDIACRLEDLAIVGQTQIVKWGMVISLSATAVFDLLLKFFPLPSSIPRAQRPTGWLAGIPTILNFASGCGAAACIIFIFWAVALGYRYRTALNIAARHARKSAFDHFDSPTHPPAPNGFV